MTDDGKTHPGDTIAKLCSDIREGLEKKNSPLMVAIAGGSCTGKSTISRAIMAEFGNLASIVHLDDFQLGEDFQFKDSPYRWDDPRNFDPDFALSSIVELSKGAAVEIPKFDLVLNKRVGNQKILPTPIVILDGLYPLMEQFLPFMDIRVYVEAQYYARFFRRIFRFTNEVDKELGSVPVKHMLTSVHRAHHRYVVGQRTVANYILSNPYSFNLETAQKYKLSEARDGHRLIRIAGLVQLPDNTEFIVGLDNHDHLTSVVTWAGKEVFRASIDESIARLISQVDWYSW